MKNHKNDKSILIVEDHDSIRMLLTNFLSKEYANVVAKKDGLDAMFWLSQGNLPDLVLLDISMPKLGGIDFLRSLKSSGFFQDIPVIMLSGNESADKDAKECLQLGAKDYIQKPFNPTTLNTKIKAILK